MVHFESSAHPEKYGAPYKYTKFIDVSYDVLPWNQLLMLIPGASMIIYHIV